MGLTEVHEITNKVLGAGGSEKTNGLAELPPIPSMMKSIPQSESNLSDIHRFWDQTGNFYLRGMGNDNITDPFIGSKCYACRNITFPRYDRHSF